MLSTGEIQSGAGSQSGSRRPVLLGSQNRLFYLFRWPHRPKVRRPAELAGGIASQAEERAITLDRTSVVVACIKVCPANRSRVLLQRHKTIYCRVVAELAVIVPSPAEQHAVGLDRAGIFAARREVCPIRSGCTLLYRYGAVASGVLRMSTAFIAT